jgi:hypothetical protein
MKKLIKNEVGPLRHDHIYNLPEEIILAFVGDCLSIENTSSIEILDCSTSMLRKKRDDISIQEVLDLIFDGKFKFFSFILRKSFENKYYWEFCASALNNGEHFLWIEVGEESGYLLAEKYKLIKNNESV